MVLQLPGTEFQVNDVSGTSVIRPRISSNGTDTFVIVWEGVTPADLDSGIYGVFITKSSFGGPCSLMRFPASGDLLVATSTFGIQEQPDVSINAQRNVVVTWVDRSGGTPQVKFQVFETSNAANMNPLDLNFSNPITAEEFAYNNPPAMQCDPKVVLCNSRFFAITWTEKTIGPSIVKLSMFKLDPVLTPVVEGLSLSSGPTSAFSPEISVNEATDDFFVIWTADDSPDIVKGQKIDNTGTPIGATFIISNPTVAASMPKISVRPFTNDFIVAWLESSETITTGLVFDVHWRIIRHNGSSPDGILGPTQIPGAFATAMGDINVYSDGSFIISWIEHINGDLVVTQYLWSDLVPITNANAQISPSSLDPHGGLTVNSGSLPTILEASLAFTRDTLFSVYSDLNMTDITGRCIEVIDRQYLSSFTSFVVTDDQHIFADPLDTIPSGIIDSAFFNPGVSAPGPRDVSDLDAFLDGRDILLIGGPIHNSMSENLMSNGSPALITSVRETEGLAISFTMTTEGGAPLDGHLYGDDAPKLLISNLSNPTASFEIARTLDAGIITDYAVIFQIKGTTNRLIFIGGIRDFGTAIAAGVLENVRRLDGSTVIQWEAMLDNHAAIVVKFTLPVSKNLDPVSSIVDSLGDLVGIPTTDITLIPVQSINSDSP